MNVSIEIDEIIITGAAVPQHGSDFERELVDQLRSLLSQDTSEWGAPRQLESLNIELSPPTDTSQSPTLATNVAHSLISSLHTPSLTPNP